LRRRASRLAAAAGRERTRPLPRRLRREIIDGP
jgi:hypothetical protein